MVTATLEAKEKKSFNPRSLRLVISLPQENRQKKENKGYINVCFSQNILQYDMLAKEMIHILGMTEQEGTRYHHLMQLESYESFSFGIFHLMFLDHG